MCSGTPSCRRSSHTATTEFEVPRSNARRPVMLLFLRDHTRLTQALSIERKAGQADTNQLAWLQGISRGNRFVQRRVEGHCYTGWLADLQAVVLQGAQQIARHSQRVTRLQGVLGFLSQV